MNRPPTPPHRLSAGGGPTSEGAELRRCRRMLREAERYGRIGHWELDLTSEALSLSPQAAELLGAVPASPPTSLDDLLQVLHPEDRPAVRRALTREASDARPCRAELRLADPDVDRILYLEGQSSFEVETGRPRRTGVLLDVTERRRLEADLHQARRLESLGRLAGGIAHDFNNLLVVILGSADVARTELDEDHPVHRDLGDILEAGERGRRLTRQLLAFSRQQMLRPTALDVAEVLGATTRMLRRLVGADVRLGVRVDDDVPPLLADRAQVEQVLMNLVLNARDAMPDGGHVRLHAVRIRHRDAPGVRLIVSDDGAGMDAHTREHLFEPFFTTKGQGKGTGLGLATVYGIVRQSDGDIRVSSTVGAGTRFEIDLPAADVAPASRPDHPGGRAEPATGRVLLVEDDLLVRRTTARVLRRGGYDVIEASDAHEAELRLAHLGGVDLVITDLIMPGRTGLDLALALRETDPDVPVLLFTAYAGGRHIHERIAHAGVPVLSKPASPDALLAAVRTCTHTDP